VFEHWFSHGKIFGLEFGEDARPNSCVGIYEVSKREGVQMQAMPDQGKECCMQELRLTSRSARAATGQRVFRF
jgi:hypothetical protein